MAITQKSGLSYQDNGVIPGGTTNQVLAKASNDDYDLKWTAGGGGGTFDTIGSGTNITAAMLVGTGASLAATGSGTITATAVPASGLTGTTLASGVTSSSLTSVGTLTGLAIAGTQAITSSSASALMVGANGATNPALQVDASTVSSATGVSIKSAAAGGGVSITAISSGTNESLNFAAKGTGNLSFAAGTQIGFTVGGSIFGATASQISFTNNSRGFTANTAWVFNAIAGSSLTASTEVLSVDFNLAATQTHATGAITLQRDMRVRPSTHAFAAGSTMTDGAGFAVDGAPIAGNNATITNSSTIYSAGRALTTGTGAVTNSYGLNIKANTGATNNYAFRFEGSAGELINLDTTGKFSLLATNTAGGTTGAQTINKPSGTVNFAAAATSLVVTNSLCTTSSIVFAVVRTNDTTATIKNVVPGSGSFTINLGAAATAETSVGFFIIN